MKKIKWKNIIGWTVAVLVAGFIVYSNMQEQKALQESGKRNIYALLPLTGGLAAIGQEYKTIIDSEMKDNDQPYNIIYVDSESNPMKGLTALQAATVSEDKPIVFSFMSSVGSAVAPYIDKQNGFMFAVSSQSINADVTTYQQVATSLADQLDPLIKHIASHYKQLDIVYIMDEYGLAQKKYVVDALNKQGFTNIRELALPMNISDPRNEVVKLLSQNPEAVFVMGNPTLGYINLFKNLKEQNFKGAVLADACLSNPSVQNNIGTNANGVISLAMRIETESQLSAKEKAFKDKIESLGIKINSKPVQAVDTLSLIKYTLENNLPFERKTYENLKGWESSSGDTVSFKDGLSTYPTILSIYRDGKYYPVEE